MAKNLGRVFVTGADGFIGSHLVEALLEQDQSVTALCLYNSNGHHGWLQPLAENRSANLSLVLGDVKDANLMHHLITGHDTVFHLASLIAIPYSYQAPQSYIDTNITGTYNVAQACLAAKVSRLIHTSTSEVYGTALTVPINENHPLQGQSPYSASKIGADMIAQSFFCSFELPVVTLRPFNTYGPRQSLRAVIPTVISQILASHQEIKLGSITPTRDFNYIADTVNAFLAVGRGGDDMLGKVYNAGSGIEVSIKEMVQMVAKIASKNIAIVSQSSRIRPKKSEVDRLLCDSTRLQEKTGWKPEYSLAKGLASMLDWMQRQGSKQDGSLYHQ